MALNFSPSAWAQAPVAKPVLSLPVPPVAADRPIPRGDHANLKVLDWAGFKAAVSYSFDDAQPSQAEHLPELFATGVPMTEYVDIVDRELTPEFDAHWRDALRHGWELGNHTAHHCHYNEVCEGVAKFDPDAEIDQAADYIVNTLGAPGVWTIAYPYGETGWEPDAPRHDFIGRGVWSGLVDPHGGDPFNLRIFGVSAGQTHADFDRGVDQARSDGRWVIFMYHSLLPTQENWYAGVEIKEVVAGVEHAKAAGDLWIDTVLNIGAYWRGQQVFEAAVKDTATTTGPATWRWTLPAHFPPGGKLRVTIDGGRLSQNGRTLKWDGHGYYEVNLDAGELSWTPGA